MSSEESYSVKYPTFSGKAEDWPCVKVKIQSVLAQKGCVELLSWPSNRDIPRDDEDLDGDNDAENDADKVLINVRKQNMKAAGILLNCIDTSTEEGKFAF